MTLSLTQRLLYRQRLYLVLFEKEGVPFEDFFVDVARRTWGPDFEPIRAQGKRGDLKCDGFLKSTGTVFQCYAPMRANERNLEKKIKTDFDGASEIWAERMREWRVVLNDKRGLAAMAQKKIDDLREEHEALSISTMLPLEIESMVFALPESEISDLLDITIGRDETRIFRVAYKDISEVVDHLVGIAPAVGGALGNIPSSQKIEANNLSPDVIQFLKKGHLLAKEVSDYFAATSRVPQGDRVAAKFREAYNGLRAASLEPDHIFFELVELAGGLTQPERVRSASLALVAHFFHTCDIFEDKPSGTL